MFLLDMVHKPTAISVIVAVVIAGILTLSVLAAMSSINQVFAQAKKPTFLSMITYPCCSRNIHPSVPTVGASFSGKLTDSQDSGIGGATIHLIGVSGFWFDTTNNFGSYSVRVDLGPGTYHIHTHYDGDSDHESSDSRTITYTVTH
jgi:hypothetical protein